MYFWQTGKICYRLLIMNEFLYRISAENKILIYSANHKHDEDS